MRTKKKPKLCCLRNSWRRDGKLTTFAARRQRNRITSGGVVSGLPAADTMLAAGGGYERRVGSFGGTDRANQGKLPLRPDAIRGERGAVRRDALHLFAVLQTRRALGLLHAGAISPDVAAGKCRDLSVGQPHRQTSFLRQLRLRHLFGIAGLVDRQAGLRKSRRSASMPGCSMISISTPCRSR